MPVLRLPKKLILRAFFIFSAAFVASILLFSTSTQAASAPQPSYGTAVVDGSASEWDLTNDFFTNLCTASNCGSKPVTSKGYLRYDCVNQVMYVLILVESGHTVTLSNADQWAAINTISNKVYTGNSGNDGVPPDFQYVVTGGVTQGYEASFSLAPGTYTIDLHMEVDGSNTSGSDFVNLSISCTDWGDLPSSYGIVTNAQNGARHTIGNLYLGSLIDGETDGQPSTKADGDNNNNKPNDEDGVIADPSFVWSVANGGKLKVTVTGPGAGVIGCLSGWMDFNNDGDFNDPGENIIANLGVTSGTTTISFSIPAGTTLPYTFYSRFRLYAATGGSCSSVTPSLTGSATNGEVEDYWMQSINNTTAAYLTSFKAAWTGFVTVRWQTANELQVTGFNVLRSAKRDGKYKPVNVKVVVAKNPGALRGSAYRFNDKTAKPGKTYFYKIQVLGTGGTLEESSIIRVKTP